MSSIAEKARQEADAVEAAEADDTAGDDTQPQPEPADTPAEPEADNEPSSNVSVEKALAQMEKENARHAAAVAKIMGDDFGLVYPCDKCADFAAGFTFTPPDDTPPMLHPDEYERCDRCNGWGRVLTGAVIDLGATQTCHRCAGQGYTEKPLAPAQPAYAAPTPAVSDQQALADQLRAQGFMVIDPPTQPRAV